MPSTGHSPVTNFGTRLEAAPFVEESPLLTNRPSLPYYLPVIPAGRRMNEAAVLTDEGAVAPLEYLPDVAVASLGGSPMLEAIIGNDDRVKVAQEFLSTNPWRQICALRIRSQSGQVYVGTAWYIAPTTLATAGHCVYLQDDGGWASSIDVIPARFGSSEPFGTIRATRFAAVDGWTVNSQRDCDYGVILLDDDTAGRQVGNFEVRTFSDAEINGVVAKISGYPADRERAQFQYFHERPVQRITSTRLFYDIDTFGGQSGSPIWEDTEEHGVVAIGIHTNGGVSSNSGTRLNADVLANLILWIGGSN
jgi:glutamyl endopeptidase